MLKDQCLLIVDDHGVVRRGLRSLLAGTEWVGEVHEAATVAEAQQLATLHPIDVVAMDINLPDGDGIEATRRILRARPTAKVLIISMDQDDATVSRALDAGACGYMLKLTEPPDLLVDALRTAAGGARVLGPDVELPRPAPLAGRHRRSLPAEMDQLTDRELEILVLVAKGCANLEIAQHLHLSEKTIRNQMTGIFAKLGVADRVKAALLAQKAHLV
ncbi:response regulator transcription factor [Kineosporia babensis]|uniref:Response regulator transcription factor n=1 Tax=Kineosporia babensis TaxID=499548 RepID=A0A9X1SSF6_9ACTN|nr:response regulator transcription factor [Kineosporia babensis]MCD5310617.1 response regulator transcription factor [Kineosporia babensis]